MAADPRPPGRASSSGPTDLGGRRRRRRAQRARSSTGSAAECERLGVERRARRRRRRLPEPAAASCSAPAARPGRRDYEVGDGAVVLDVADVRGGTADAPAGGRHRAVRPDRRADRRRPRRGARRRGPCSSPRTRSPATSWPAPATWPRPTCAWPRRGVRIERRSLLVGVAAGEVDAAGPLHRARPHDPVRRARRLRLPPAHRAAAGARRCRPATASPRARSTRRSSRAGARRSLCAPSLDAPGQPVVVGVTVSI